MSREGVPAERGRSGGRRSIEDRERRRGPRDEPGLLDLDGEPDDGLRGDDDRSPRGCRQEVDDVGQARRAEVGADDRAHVELDVDRASAVQGAREHDAVSSERAVEGDRTQAFERGRIHVATFAVRRRAQASRGLPEETASHREDAQSHAGEREPHQSDTDTSRHGARPNGDCW